MLRADLQAVRTWLLECALPLWAGRGMDHALGLPHETLSLAGTPPQVGLRRVLVIARQTYVFAEASRLGFAAGPELVAMLVRNLVRLAWQGPADGFATSLNPDGSVLDGRAHLYTHAFILFALHMAALATGDALADEYADRTRRFIVEQMRHPDGVGFVASRGDTTARLQNPHMHLLEATLFGVQRNKNQDDAALSQELLDLVMRHVLCPRLGVMMEKFDPRQPQPDRLEGQWLEPGHQFEWAWLLWKNEEVLGRNYRGTALRMAHFAERHGVRDDGHIYMSLHPDGRILDSSSRTWHHTERLKAWLVFPGYNREAGRLARQTMDQQLFARFLDRPTAGLWHDHFAADGQLQAQQVPTSTFYHVMLALSEYLRHGAKLLIYDKVA